MSNFFVSLGYLIGYVKSKNRKWSEFGKSFESSERKSNQNKTK
jgi:hypothetical protein